ncbi:MAG TPA: hypothetical protein VNZ22_20300 [Bacillota bacterium]|nr:hypothetical protein [Bacillota bacterium]
MSALQLELSENRTAYEPGEELVGTAHWKLEEPPRAVELRLFWFTRGKGTEDAGVIETRRFDRPSREETHSFRLRLPQEPYSFSGKLISLVWALELVAEPSKAVTRLEIIMAPGQREVRLDSLPEAENQKKRALAPWTTATS